MFTHFFPPIIDPIGLFAVFVPFGIVCLVPRSQFPYLMAWLAALALIWILLPTTDSPFRRGSPGDFMVPILQIYLIYGLAYGVVLKLALFLILDRGRAAESFLGPIGLGILVGIVIILGLAALLQPVRPSWMTHTLFALFVALWIEIPRWRRRPIRSEQIWRFTVWLNRTVLGLTLVATFWGFFNAAAVLRQAENFAWGRPYCIQIAKNGFGMTPATSLLDLSPLTMRSYCSPKYGCSENHAVLVIDSVIAAHWSYGAFDFRPRPQPASIACRIRPHYVLGLDLFGF